MKQSPFGSLTSSDFIKGFIVAVIVAVLTAVLETFNAGSLSINWTKVAIVAGTAGIGYILKNLGTNSEDKFLKKEPTDL